MSLVWLIVLFLTPLICLHAVKQIYSNYDEKRFAKFKNERIEAKEIGFLDIVLMKTSPILRLILIFFIYLVCLSELINNKGLIFSLTSPQVALILSILSSIYMIIILIKKRYNLFITITSSILTILYIVINIVITTIYT